MFYKLDDRVLLRGWKLLPYAVVDSEAGAVGFLNKSGFEAASMATGTIDFDLPLIKPEVREAAKQLAEAGILHELAPGEATGLSPEQEYRCYPSRYVESLHWSITGKCNYRCKHCYMSAPEAKLGELSHEQIMRIIDDFERCGILNVSLTGGEPLVRSDFLEIVDALLDKGIHISQIYSNGKLVTPKLLDELEARGIHPEFSMSFDGVGWHDWMRGVPGAEEAVERAFRLCQERGFPTDAEMAIHEGSKGVLRESIKKLGEWGCSSVKTNPVMPVGEWEEKRLGMPIEQDEMNRVYLDYIPQYFEDDMPLETLNLGGFFLVQKSRPEHYMVGVNRHCEDPENQLICASSRLHAYLAPDGVLLPCIPLSSNDEVTKRYPNVVEVGLAAALDDPVYRGSVDCRVQAFLEANPSCLECRYLKSCAGGCRAHALNEDPDDYLGIDPVVCDFYLSGWSERVDAVAKEAVEAYLERNPAKEEAVAEA